MFRSKEQAAYAKLIEKAIAWPGPPLLAGAAAGLGKTHGFSIPLLQSGKRVALAFSTRALIAQYLASEALHAALQRAPQTSVAELLSRREFATTSAYQAHRQQALQAQVLLLTHAAALIDARTPAYADLRSRDVLLFDEADLLADAAQLRSTFEISTRVLKECHVADGQPTEVTRLRAIVEVVKRKAAEAEDRAAAAAMLYALETPRWYKRVGWSEQGELVLMHAMPGRMLGPLLADAKRVIFTSGTLQVGGSFDHFVRALGIAQLDPASRHIDPAQHGSLDIFVVDRALTRQAQAQRIALAPRPALVLTTSHAATKELALLLPNAVVRAEDEPLAQALARCAQDSVLIAAGAWSGLDEPRLRWATVAIPDVPYGVPNQVSGQAVSHYIDSVVCAVRRTNQGLHRGLRSPDAHCKLLLLDARFNRQELKAAIPSRFLSPDGSLPSIHEGIAHQMTQRERHVRAAALKHYGPQCMWPGCSETQEHRLQAHHEDQIAHGERFTGLQDVKIYCAHHHLDVHHAMRLTK